MTSYQRQGELPADLRSPESEALFRLHRWLSYEVRSGWLICLIFFLPYGIVLTGLLGLMAVFIPVIILQLYRARWFGTIAGFVLMMVAAWSFPRMVITDPRMIVAVYSISLFVPFYFFCWILRWVVGDKVTEIRGMEAFRREDASADPSPRPDSIQGSNPSMG